MVEGLCTYKDIYTLSLDDFVCMNEIVDVKRYNEESANRYYTKLSQSKSKNN